MDLPDEIVAYILSMIPIKMIRYCYCVCKRWHSIITEPYFANLHLSRSPDCLIIYRPNFYDEYAIHSLAELDDTPYPDIQDGPLMFFDHDENKVRDDDFLRHSEWPLCGSINGLLCLWHTIGATCICNPITREYILLADNKNLRKLSRFPIYGFGFVKASHEYKVVCLYQGDFPSSAGSGKSWCEVYTLGTGMWRSLGQVPFLVSTRDRRNRVSSYESDYTSWYGSHDGVFIRSNLHWLIYDLNTNQERVCTFDLKKEEFQLTAPPRVTKKVDYRRLGMLGECLCVCDNTGESGFTIWVLKGYGNKQSWSKELFIDQSSNQQYGPVHPLKLFKDGTVLFSLRSYQLIYHSADKTFETFSMCWNDHFNKPLAMVFVPGFIRLKSFVSEKVKFF
ncbi:hypothetical protein DCAR_0314297 [Daucus carota subsp. sativus]|uniref:F-box domain-containing protein n=2 Tax=Daucus carota subsp. sativus TaxID=79200 RepID=A0AAF1AWN3_DAUCS|nr:hypothetical protein DCAR_0314297 [Daucus carota subsp. sativus]